ncbi:MAG: hypothetical protein AAFR96_13300 [Planctomycetota bacterium]
MDTKLQHVSSGFCQWWEMLHTFAPDDVPMGLYEVRSAAEAVYLSRRDCSVLEEFALPVMEQIQSRKSLSKALRVQRSRLGRHFMNARINTSQFDVVRDPPVF